MTGTRPADVARAVAAAHRTLGLARTATAADVKHAYRLFASLRHPDHNPGDPGAAEQFRTIRFAADVLTDVRAGRPPADHKIRALLGLPAPEPDPRIVAAYCPSVPVPSIDLTL